MTYDLLSAQGLQILRYWFGIANPEQREAMFTFNKPSKSNIILI